MVEDATWVLFLVTLVAHGVNWWLLFLIVFAVGRLRGCFTWNS